MLWCDLEQLLIDRVGLQQMVVLLKKDGQRKRLIEVQALGRY
jgi:hypothetical protein